MTKLEDFNKAANDIMKDITVSDELRGKTLLKVKRQKSSYIKNTLVPAACIMILIVSLSMWKSALNRANINNKAGNSNIENANILKSSEIITLPEGNAANPSKATISVSINTLAEAKKFLGNMPIEPSYLPKKARLIGIQGVSYNNENRRSVWAQYALGEGTFVISAEQNSQWKSFEGYEDVDINGASGHVIYFKDNNYEGTELRWFEGKHMYTVEGGIAREEAVKIAKSLK